ncbi:unnamed protein product [Periconia digitata]|uniref:Uncharacterized protein n=1 Tax=Periconia digitata TaxID=1303443 RepID=A0A9W4ULY1_9PLEO|nr:unnamed protein product [Periconia digitata]
MSDTIFLIVRTFAGTPHPFKVFEVTPNGEIWTRVENRKANSYAVITVAIRTSTDSDAPLSFFDVKVEFMRPNYGKEGDIIGYYGTYEDASNRMRDLWIDNLGVQADEDEDMGHFAFQLDKGVYWYFDILRVSLPSAAKTSAPARASATASISTSASAAASDASSPPPPSSAATPAADSQSS